MCKDLYDGVNVELAHIAGAAKSTRADDALIALRQMAAPLFALDVSYSVLSIMSRSIALLDSSDNEPLSLVSVKLMLFYSPSLFKLILPLLFIFLLVGYHWISGTALIKYVIIFSCFGYISRRS